MVKKVGLVIFAFLVVITSFAMISANLEISKQTISSIGVPSLDKPALFNITLKNLGNDDNFLIYSLAGVDIKPNESIFIANGQTKSILTEFYTLFPIKTSPDYYSLEFKVKGLQTEAQVDEVSVILVAPKDAFDIILEDITVDSQNAVLHFKNKYGGRFDKVSLELTSPLFEFSQDFSLNGNEDKVLEIVLDAETIKTLLAGQYIVEAKIKVADIIAEKKAVINFNERTGIAVLESIEGRIMIRHEIEKKNNGNMPAQVSISVSKNLFASLFTSFNIVASKKELSGFRIISTFNKQLSPGESLKVIARTNWWILVALIIAIWVIYYLISKYVANKIVLRKNVSFVRTKGGEFALKVSIKVKARDFAERIKIVDRLPPMLKVFERYGIAAPEKIDESNRRLEWNIAALSAGEERVLSYIVYSKIGVMGRFELPAAEAIYEYQGKIKEASSNRAFYLNEQK